MSKIVEKDEMSKLPYIIAVDFDGVIVEDNYPEIKNVNSVIVELLFEAQQRGAKLILWTCRNDVLLAQAVIACNRIGLKFDAVNQNIPEVIEMFGQDTRKVYANEYWGDKAVLFCSSDDKEQIGGGELHVCSKCNHAYQAYTSEGRCPICHQ